MRRPGLGLLLITLCAPLAGASCGPEPSAECEDPGVLCTLAGTGQLGYNGEGLPALETWLFYPSAVRRCADGALLLVDFNNFLVRELAEDGTLQTRAGNNLHGWAVEGPALQSPLENPIDLACGPDGSWFIAELHTSRVLRIDPEGSLSIWAGTGDYGYSGDGGPASEGTFSEVTGLDLGPDGTLYLSDSTNHAIRAVSPDGTLYTLAGDGQAGLVDGPGASARFNTPQHLRYAEGALWVADTFNNAVRRIDLDGAEVSTVAGTGEPGYGGDGGPASAATLRYPYGVTALDGQVYISDSGNHALRVVDAQGLIHTWAGTGDAGYDPLPQLAQEADLYWPADLLIDDDGSLILADMRNGVLRRMWPPTP